MNELFSVFGIPIQRQSLIIDKISISLLSSKLKSDVIKFFINDKELTEVEKSICLFVVSGYIQNQEDKLE